MAQQELGQEITIADVLQRGWQYRGLFLILPALAAVLAVAMLMAQSLNLRTPIVYYVTLKSIEDGKYPNGSQFAPTDLLIPEVIASVARQFDLQDIATLRRAFQVRYGSVLEDGVNAKYRQMLSAAGTASSTEIDSINAAYGEELRRTVRSGLRIDLDYVSLGVDETTGGAIAAALPEAWSKIYPQIFKILVDSRLQEVAVSRTPVDLNDTAGLLSAGATLRNVRKGLTAISEDVRINAMATRIGNNAASLVQDLDWFSTQYFDPLFNSAGGENPIAQTYVRQIEFEIANQQRQLAGLADTIRDLQNFRNAKPDAGTPPTTQESSAGPAGMQINEGGIAEIAGLVERATLADYLRNILNQRQDKIVAISFLQKDLATLNDPLASNLDASFKTKASQQFKTLVAEYSELLAVARARLAASMGELYIPASSPVVTGSIITPRALTIVGIAILVGLLLAALIALAMPTMKRVAVAAVSSSKRVTRSSARS